VAETTTRPVAMAVTVPFKETDAMLVFPVLQETWRPNSWTPLRSRTVAMSCWVEPASREMESG
jgi:hypothetical protein